MGNKVQSYLFYLSRSKAFPSFLKIVLNVNERRRRRRRGVVPNGRHPVPIPKLFFQKISTIAICLCLENGQN